jgi:hypothetical protein
MLEGTHSEWHRHDARIPAKYTLAEYVTKELSEQARYELVILLPEVWPQE